jgi:hypothetical protein
MDAQIARILTFGGHPVAAESLLAGALCASGGPP